MECFDLDMKLFYDLIDRNYQRNYSEYPMISSNDLKCFKDRLTDLSNQSIINEDADKLYDPILDSLVRSSLADLLYIKKNRIDFKDFVEFHPNYIRFQFMDDLIVSKSSVTLGSFKLLEFSPSAASMDCGILIQKVDDLLQNPIIKIIINSFVRKLQVEGDQLERLIGFVKTKRKPTRGLGLLYFVLMDMYLESIDKLIHNMINKSGLNFFWCRSIDTAILGFTDGKTLKKFNEILQLHIALPTWGLTARVRSGTRGGKVLRPFNGKLYINNEGILQWKRPDSIISE